MFFLPGHSKKNHFFFLFMLSFVLKFIHDVSSQQFVLVYHSYYCQIPFSLDSCTNEVAEDGCKPRVMNNFSFSSIVFSIETYKVIHERNSMWVFILIKDQVIEPYKFFGCKVILLQRANKLQQCICICKE